MREEYANLLMLAVLFTALGHAPVLQGYVIHTPLSEPILLYGLFNEHDTLDFDGDGTIELTFSSSVTFVGVRSEGPTRILIWKSPPPNLGGPVEALPDGFEIGPNSGVDNLLWFAGFSDDPSSPNYDADFRTLVQCYNTGCGGRFRSGRRAYMGVELALDTGTHYGWVDLETDRLIPAGWIHGWAYETEPGMPILAGAVPEPGTFLLAGAGALTLWVRRRPRRG